jgi:hypothetical protein
LQSRRAALGFVAGAAALAAVAPASKAGYGDSANVFGRVTNKSGARRIRHHTVFASHPPALQR